MQSGNNGQARAGGGQTIVAGWQPVGPGILPDGFMAVSDRVSKCILYRYQMADPFLDAGSGRQLACFLPIHQN